MKDFKEIFKTLEENSKTEIKPETKPETKPEVKPIEIKTPEEIEVSKLTKEEILDILFTFFPDLKNYRIPEEELLKAVYQAVKVHKLNPLKKECYIIPFWNKKRNVYELQIITNYLTYIKKALHSGLCQGIKVYSKKDADGNIYAQATVWRKGWVHPVEVMVHLDEFQRRMEGKPMWKEMPRLMLEKCALARAFRIAFADILAELPYTEEEMPTPEILEISEISEKSETKEE